MDVTGGLMLFFLGMLVGLCIMAGFNGTGETPSMRMLTRNVCVHPAAVCKCGVAYMLPYNNLALGPKRCEECGSSEMRLESRTFNNDTWQMPRTANSAK